jgi:hypothetical protein
MIYAGTWERDNGRIVGMVGVFSSIRSLMANVRKDSGFRAGDYVFVWEEAVDMPEVTGNTPAAVYQLAYDGEWELVAQPTAPEDD